MGLSTNRSRVTHDICVSMELLAHADSSEYYETETRESVYKAGDANGFKRGVMDNLVSCLTNLMRADSLTLEQAMDKLEVPKADRVNIRKAFEKQ